MGITGKLLKSVLAKPSLVAALAGIMAGSLLLLTAILKPLVMVPLGIAILTAGFIFAGLRWKRALDSRLKRVLDDTSQLKELRYQLAIQESRFLSPLPWSDWALPPSGLIRILDRIVCEGRTQIVECGAGLSTLYIASLLKNMGGGRLVTLEQDEQWSAKILTLLSRNNLEDWVTIYHRPLVEVKCLGRRTTWYDVGDTQTLLPSPIDLLLVDGPTGDSSPMARLGALPILWPSLAKGALVYLDDVMRAEEKRILEIWCAQYDLDVTYIDQGHGLVEMQVQKAASAG